MIDYYFSFNENIERIELIHHGKPVEYMDGKQSECQSASMLMM